MRNHYIPKFLIKNFSNDGRSVWAHRKGSEKEEAKIFNTNASNLFSEIGRYAIYDIDNNGVPIGAPDYSLEQHLSDLETKARQVIKKILRYISSNGDRGSFCLGIEEQKVLIEFIFTCNMRARDHEEYRKKFSPSGRVVLDWEEKAKKIKGDTESLNQILTKQRSTARAEAVQNSRSRFLELYPLNSIGFSIGYSEKHEFIIGSTPIANVYPPRMNYINYKKTCEQFQVEPLNFEDFNGKHLPRCLHDVSDRYHGSWLPISSRVVIADNRNAKKEILKLNNRFVENINTNIYMASETIAASSESVINSTIKQSYSG